MLYMHLTADREVNLPSGDYYDCCFFLRSVLSLLPPNCRFVWIVNILVGWDQARSFLKNLYNSMYTEHL